MTALAEVGFLVFIVRPGCEPQHGIGGEKGHGAVETGLVGEQKSLADTLAHDIGIGQAFHRGGPVGVVEAVGIGR